MSLVLHGSVQRTAVVAIEQLMADGVLASATYWSEIDSTNSAALAELRDRRLSEDDLPRLYLTDTQTAGRGRHGRTWLSGNDSLTFSLVIRRTVDASQTTTLWPIAVGVAIARTIEFCFAPLRTQLKWPNDVYLDGGKVAGILLETTHGTPETVVIGIGINVGAAPTREQTSGYKATAIASVIGRPCSRYDLLSPLIEQVVEATESVVHSPDEIIDEFRQRCFLTDKGVTYQDKGVPGKAICRGINDAGELLLETAGGVTACQTGEVNLLRANP